MKNFAAVCIAVGVVLLVGCDKNAAVPNTQSNVNQSEVSDITVL